MLGILDTYLLPPSLRLLWLAFRRRLILSAAVLASFCSPHSRFLCSICPSLGIVPSWSTLRSYIALSRISPFPTPLSLSFPFDHYHRPSVSSSSLSFRRPFPHLIQDNSSSSFGLLPFFTLPSPRSLLHAPPLQTHLALEHLFASSLSHSDKLIRSSQHVQTTLHLPHLVMAI